jgi:hypothetical protein
MKIRCPHCNEMTTWEENPYRPFCSERCKLLDLGAWADGEYRVPGAPVPADSAEDDDEHSY